MTTKAFTLIEMLVTISIISILLGIGLYSYNQYSSKRDLENDVYKIFSLANKARVSSFTEKSSYYLYLSNNGYEAVLDNNTSLNDGYIEKIILKKRFLSDNSTFIFDQNGFLKNSGKIYPEDLKDVQYNCVNFANMVYLGKISGGNCVY